MKIHHVRIIPNYLRLPIHLSSYIPGKTPLSTPAEVGTAVVVYLAIVFGIQCVMKDRPPLELTRAVRVHNLLLSIGSLILLLCIAEEIISLWSSLGFYSLVCSLSAYTEKLEFYYMVNYFFKYVEFLDTVFLALRKRPLAFLHVFHHATVTVLCHISLAYEVTGSWTIISVNLMVHVTMYYYYFATVGGAKFWWKKHLTIIQILQFVLDLGFITFFGYHHFTTENMVYLPRMGDCPALIAGEHDSRLLAACTVLILGSYLFLFLDFYRKSYKPRNRDRISVEKLQIRGYQLENRAKGD
ncbi:GNS1/SUR4 membrane protein [Suillus lakei]|nr:GNS1/SUR4 membrane protein [Suillus lakei]